MGWQGRLLLPPLPHHRLYDSEEFRLRVVMKAVLVAMIVDCQFASWELVEKNVTSYLSALRTIFLEVLH